MKEHDKFCFYKRSVYRNFATLEPSQEVLNDLVASQKDQDILKNTFYDIHESGQTPIERVLKKSNRQIIQDELDSKFKPENWYKSRYSNGSWSVLYTAESKLTALKEILFHLKQFYKEELSSKKIIVDRRVIKLSISAQKCIDLIIQKKIKKEKLISSDDSGYPYCQQLAKKFIQAGAEMLRAPSARHDNGICVPIFEKKVIKKDYGHLKYLKLILSEDETKVFQEGKTYQI